MTGRDGLAQNSIDAVRSNGTKINATLIPRARAIKQATGRGNL